MNPQSIVSGSLGKGNLGDEALLDTYLKQHSSDYRTIAVLREDHRTGPVKLGP